MRRYRKQIILTSVTALAILILVLLSPQIYTITIQQEQATTTTPALSQDFPVTVDPKNKIIIENELVNAYLKDNHSLLGASIIDAGNYIWNIFRNIATTVANAPWYQSVANVSSRFVTITPGIRKEQIVNIFGDTLGWNNKQRKMLGSISEGSFAPGTYIVSIGTAPDSIQTMISDRFSKDVLSHYGTSTQDVVPLEDALTIASLIQRETISTDGMRLLSGIIWNRLFANMNLQIDSTLQYAKANNPAEESWWPKVLPKDKYLKSPYNTYTHAGLPPSPIANPSVAAILAALNPIKTPCLFYFNDKSGSFHCSATYAEHTKLLREYY